MRELEQARQLEFAGDLRGAALACEEALRRGADPVQTRLRLGALNLRLGRYGPALQHLKQLLAESPGHAGALSLQGTLLYRLRRFGEARAALEQSLRLNSDSPETQFNLGLARFESADLEGAARAFAECLRLRRGAPWNADPGQLELEPSPVFDDGEMAVNEVKLRHDLEQLEYLLEAGRLPPAFAGLAAAYRALLQETGKTDGHVVSPFSPQRHPLVARSYKRPLHVAAAAAAGPTLNPKLDAAAIERQYRKSQPNLVVVDELLTGDALDALRRFCLESTIWNNIQAGYLGAYFFDGFAGDLVLRIAREMQQRLPGILRGQALQMLWGYKYDHELQGIGVHADAAAVNVNFWITPDEANLEPAGGGLLVWRHAAPADWDFERFNRDPAAIMEFLNAAGDEPIRVPYRANRAVIFDSDLFHATDRLRFREGYRNRRINVTLLYGLRSSS